MLDYRRKFIEAAQRYNELSYKSIVHESERLEALKHALHCTILASAGETSRFIQSVEWVAGLMLLCRLTLALTGPQDSSGLGC